MDTDKTSTRMLDANSFNITENLDSSFPNEIATSAFDNKSDNCEYLEFSKDMLDFLIFEEE